MQPKHNIYIVIDSDISYDNIEIYRTHMVSISDGRWEVKQVQAERKSDLTPAVDVKKYLEGIEFPV